MFAKCLKYDLKALFRKWWVPACFALPILSVFLFFCYGPLTESEDIGAALFHHHFASGLLLLTALIYAVFAFMSILLPYYHFYKKLFSSEGYLTFALPVKRSTMYLSKLFSAFILQATFVVTSFLSIYFITPLLDYKGNKLSPSGAFYKFLSGRTDLTSIDYLWIFEMIVIFALMLLLIINVIYLGIIIYSTAKKYTKYIITGLLILSAPALFYLFIIVTNMLPPYSTFGDYFIWPNRPIICSLVLLAAILAYGILNVMVSLYNISHLERKLNI